MRRALVLVLAVVSCTGCKKLLSRALVDDGDAGAADASLVATADPGASAVASAASSAVAVTPAAVTATAKVPRCAAGESFVQLETGERACVTDCIDPSCDCKKGVVVLASGALGSAPGDRRAFCPKAKAGAKKALPKCAGGLSLVADDESSPPFCAKICGGDAECKPARCDGQGFTVDDKTGAVFTGVGKSVPICGKGAAPTAASASAASSSTTLAIPPGGPGVIQNPNGQPCPAGYNNAGGVLKTCNKVCTLGGKCPAGSKCSDVLLVCR